MKFNKTSSGLREVGSALDLKTHCNQNKKLLLMNITMTMTMIMIMIMLQIGETAVQHKQAALDWASY